MNDRVRERSRAAEPFPIRFNTVKTGTERPAMGSVGGERFKSRWPNFQVVEPITQGSVFESPL